MIYFLCFILGILASFIVLALYCCIVVGAEADKKIKEMNNNKENIKWVIKNYKVNVDIV